MKILLGNNTLCFLGGSETHTLTLAKALKRKGHEVFCYSPLLGEISKRLEKEGIKCSTEPKESDVIIASHYKVVEYLRLRFPATPIISTIHGVQHLLFNNTGSVWAPEHPALGKANQFVAVSEEVQKKLKDDYGLDSIIIRNFFEIEEHEINASPRNILFNSNYETRNGEVFKKIQEIAKHYKADLVAIGENFGQTANVRDLVIKSDMVIGMGRSVLEGVVMGRLGVVEGRWGTGGVVCEENIDALKYFNFSGRNSEGKYLTAQELIAEIDKHYNPKTIDWQMVYMKNQHDVENAVDKYIELVNKLIGGYEKKE